METGTSTQVLPIALLWQRLLLLLLVAVYSVQGGTLIGFTKESYPDPQSNHTACGRPRPSWVCDPGRYLTEEQGDAVDANINALGGQGGSGTVLINIVPQLIYNGDLVSSSQQHRTSFAQYLYQTRRPVNGTVLVIVAYFITGNSVALTFGPSKLTADCFCQLTYESQQYISSTGFSTLLNIYSRKLRLILKGVEQCTTSQDNVPWMVDYAGTCTWNQRIVVRQISPSYGPTTGQTVVRLIGENLDLVTGNVVIGTTICEGVERSPNLILFITAPLHNLNDANKALPVYLLLGTVKFNSGKLFTYRTNMTTSTVGPTTTWATIPSMKPKRLISVKTIRPTTITISGGLRLTVEGQNLDLVDDATMVSTLTGLSTGRVVEYSTPCEPGTSTRMYCVAPTLELDKVQSSIRSFPRLQGSTGKLVRKKRATGSDGIPSQQIRDVNVTVKLNVNGLLLELDDFRGKPFPLMVYANPTLSRFNSKDETVTFISVWPKKERQIEIDGTGLLPVLENHQVYVRIGNDLCDSVTIYLSRLVCRPPIKQPEANDTNPFVQVSVGHLEFRIGYLEYKDTLWRYLPTRYALIGGQITIMASTAIIIAIVLVCTHRK